MSELRTVTEHRCVVRLRTTAWDDKNSIHIKRSLTFLRRQCKGWNILREDCLEVGADEVVDRITNLDQCNDGVYEVVACDQSKDWESGHIDDWNYRMIPIGELAR